MLLYFYPKHATWKSGTRRNLNGQNNTSETLNNYSEENYMISESQWTKALHVIHGMTINGKALHVIHGMTINGKALHVIHGMTINGNSSLVYGL